MEVNSPTILDYGNLAVGAGTFLLAIVLGISNYSRSIKDRKVHMADKRYEWINEFRENVAQILSISSEINILREAGLYDEANAIFNELRLKVNLVRLMLDNNIEDSHLLLEKLGNLLVHSFGHDLSQDFLALDNEVYSASQKIINKEWSRIENLKY
tara:strand:- start:989 stop:1456 length:468 start_codon:yes stop_codon:yes gene_type:complete